MSQLSLGQRDLPTLRKEAREPGQPCACCGHLLKVYRIPLNQSMAKALTWISAHASKVVEKGNPRAWVHVADNAPNSILRSRDYPKLAWWGLLEEAPNHGDDSVRTSGVWRLTERGVQWLRGECRVPSHVFREGGSIVGREDTLVSIMDILPEGPRFHYRKLMEGEL